MKKIAVLLASFLMSIPLHAEMSFVEAIYQAEDHGNWEPIETLFSNALRAGHSPFEGHTDQGGVLLALYFLAGKQTTTAGIDRTIKLVQQAIQMGASPMVKVVFDGGDSPFGKIPVTAADVILNEWIQRSKQSHPTDRALIVGAERMFQIFFETKSLNPNYQTFWATSPDEWRKVGFVHKVLLDGGPKKMIEFFLKYDVKLGSRDDAEWNMAMVAAALGDIEALKTMAHSCGQVDTQALFNYKCTINFNPTVLHAAVMAARSEKNGADIAFSVIKFLVENGADPLQRSMFHSLIDEVQFWVSQDPEHRGEFLKLKRKLEKSSDELKQIHRNYCSRLSKPL